MSPYTAPYVQTYIKVCKANNIQCDLVYWDRDGKENIDISDELVNHIPFEKHVSFNDIKFKRYLPYVGATHHIRKRIKDVNYDGLVFLNTHAAVACADIINKKYKGKFILDIRDFTLENFALYRKIEKSIIDNSYATVISSKAYCAFLPEHDYVIAHNYTPIPEGQIRDIKRFGALPDPITISFIGNVRFFKMANQIISVFGNDERYCIGYYGTGAKVLQKYISEEGISNLVLVDTFPVSETLKYYMTCSLINNLYGNNNKYLDYAVSNKLYYAAQLNIPILVCKDTYMEQLVEEYHLGFSVNFGEKDVADCVYKNYHNFDWESMRIGAERFLKMVSNEMQFFTNTLNYFTNSCKNSKL